MLIQFKDLSQPFNSFNNHIQSVINNYILILSSLSLLYFCCYFLSFFQFLLLLSLVLEARDPFYACHITNKSNSINESVITVQVLLQTINKFIYSTEQQAMQFQHTWDTEFNRIVQGLANNNNSLYQSQLNNENKNRPKGLAIRRQESRVMNAEELIRSYDNYSPLSDLVNWKQLKNKNTFAVKKYRESIYFGEYVDNKRAGIGVMLYTNSRVYEGQWYDNFKHGKGYEKFPNGAIYSGTYANGKPQGYGTYSWENGQTYEGQWLDGMKSGSGIWRGPNGDSYIGQWSNGQANGYGVHTWVNGDRYEGQFKDCLKHGEGVQKFSNGDSYKGTYVMGKPHGYGQYYWAIGSYFKGNFQCGMRSGKGIWKRGPGNSDKYEGQYRQDKKQGYGIFQWENGNIYKGNFSNDLKNGYGEMYWTNGKIYKGEWINNQQAGGVEQFSEETHEINLQRYRNEQLESRSSKGRLKYKKNEPQIFEENEDLFQLHNGNFHEPSPPQFIETNRKFRARGIQLKRQNRTQSHRSHRSNNQAHLNSTTNDQNKFVRKYSMGSRCSDNKKIKQGNSQTKMMSSTFFLYKIHATPAGEDNYVKPKPRQVKTSGGMRQKHISQQIKYFTRSKINPEFL